MNRAIMYAKIFMEKTRILASLRHVFRKKRASLDIRVLQKSLALTHLPVFFRPSLSTLHTSIFFPDLASSCVIWVISPCGKGLQLKIEKYSQNLIVSFSLASPIHRTCASFLSRKLKPETSRFAWPAFIGCSRCLVSFS
jgi:hypothetical protein